MNQNSATESTDERTHFWQQRAWTELLGYVDEAVADGGRIDPAGMRAYMAELKRRYQLPPTAENLLALMRDAGATTGDCTNANTACGYREPHEHGFACDPTCACGGSAAGPSGVSV